jgi:ATP-dependent protease ClpP protease subunit
MKPTKYLQNYKGSTEAKRTRNEEEESDEQPENFLGFFEVSQSFSQVKVFLDETVREPKYYRQVLTRLDSLNEGDELEFRINTYGGNLDSTLAIVNVIKHTEANVIGYIDGVAASAGSIIALSCPTVQVAPHATMMVHSAFGGSAGILNNLANHSNFIDQQVRSLMKDTYAGFLTDEELEQVYLGREFWFNAEEIITRLERRFELQKQQYEQMLKTEEIQARANKAMAEDELQGGTEVKPKRKTRKDTTV